MPRKTGNTKRKIVDAAWKLFYEQGFENTTVEDIIFESCTSKGSFYHYFKGKEDFGNIKHKDGILHSLPSLFL